MSKSTLADVSIQNYLAKRVDAKIKYETGLLIGQWDEDRAYVISSAPTPGSNDESKWTKDGADLILQHAQLLSRMTCGGLHVIGMYIISRSAEIDRLVSKGCLEDVLRDLPMLEDSNSAINRVLVTCPQSSKVDAALYSYKGRKLVSKPKPGNLKFQRLKERMHCFNTTYQIDLRIPVSSGQKLSDQLIKGVQPTIKSIEESLANFSGGAGPSNSDWVKQSIEKVYEQQKSGGKKNKKDAAADSAFHEVELLSFENTVDFKSSIDSSTDDEVAGVVRVCGVMYGCASIYSKSSCATAVRAVKDDLINSLLSRIRLLAEEEEDEDEGTEFSVPSSSSHVWTLPKRMLLSKEPDIPIFCDYLFRHETMTDCQDRVAEILDLTDFQETCKEDFMSEASVTALKDAKPVVPKLPVAVPAVEDSQKKTKAPKKNAREARSHSHSKVGMSDDMKTAIGAGVVFFAITVYFVRLYLLE